MKLHTLLFIFFFGVNNSISLTAVENHLQEYKENRGNTDYFLMVTLAYTKSIIAKVYESVENGWHYFLSHSIADQVQKDAEEIAAFLKQSDELYYAENSPLRGNPLKQEIMEYLMRSNSVIHDIIKSNAVELEMPCSIACNFPLHETISESPNRIYTARACVGGIIEIGKNHAEHFSLQEPRKPLIVRIQWRADSKILFSELHNDTTSIWKIETREHICSLPYCSMRYNPTMTHLVGGTRNGDVKLLKADTYEVVKTFKGHTDWVRNICWSPNGEFIASGSFDRTIRIWHVATGTCILAWPLSFHVNYLEWDWDDNILYAMDKVTYESSVYAWNMKDILTLGTLNEDQILLFEALKNKNDKLNTINTRLLKVAQSLPPFIKISLMNLNIMPHLFMTIKYGKQEIPLPARQQNTRNST